VAVQAKGAKNYTDFTLFLDGFEADNHKLYENQPFSTFIDHDFGHYFEFKLDDDP